MSKDLDIRVINASDLALPKHETEHSAGVDLRANIDSPIILKPLERKLIPTGISIELPEGYEAQIRPRSGLAYKHGISIVNAPGTIDADYRGEIKVLLVNLSDTNFTVERGERIAQMIVAPYQRINLVPVKSLSDTDRGAGGYGSTGKG